VAREVDPVCRCGFFSCFWPAPGYVHAEEACFWCCVAFVCLFFFFFVKVVLCRCVGLGMRAAIVSTGKGRVIKEEHLEGVGEGGWKETGPEGRMGGVEVQVPWV
jgi:hypothetical protein